MTEPIWVNTEDCHAIHAQLLQRFGGREGVRDGGMLESALGRPMNAWAYGEGSLFVLAAHYAAGIVRNHPFVDGNKRTGFVAAALFLEINDLRFNAPEEEAVEYTLALAAGAMAEADYAAWLERSCGPQSDPEPTT